MLIKLNYCDFLLCRKTYENCVKTILTSKSNTITIGCAHICRQADRQTGRHIHTNTHTYDVILSVCLECFRTFVISACANQPTNWASIQLNFLLFSLHLIAAHKRLNHTKIVQLFQWIIIVDGNDDHEWMGCHPSKTWKYIGDLRRNKLWKHSSLAIQTHHFKSQIGNNITSSNTFVLY